MLHKDFDFKNPDYAKVFRERIAFLREIRGDPSMLPGLKAYYKNNLADFVCDWGVTFDPRAIERGLPSTIPFILFPKQREWFEWILERWKAQESGLTEKSRDMGITWSAVALASSLCLFNDGVVVGFGSRKTEYVDHLGTMTPILPKARFFLDHIPEEFRQGFSSQRDAPYLRITIPKTGSMITGEGGDDIGRGDRCSIHFFDEAQPLDALIVTPDGYKTMADMAPGSIVTGKDGQPQRVTHINDCGVYDVFRLTFSDGTSAECSPNHLWTVQKVLGKREILTLRTNEILDKYLYQTPDGKHTQYRFRLPSCEPVQFSLSSDSLPLDPYLVGAILGDGSSRSGCIRITSADAEVLEWFRRLLPPGIILGAFDGKYTYNIVDELGRQGYRTRSRARLVIEQIGISNVICYDKFVPDAYKMSTPENRLSILQGLMDTDGCGSDGYPSFHTSSRKLADDVRFIVQSLGGSAVTNVKTDARGYRDQYYVSVMLPDGMPPFRLSRKLNSLKKRKHPPHRTIVGMELIGRKPVRCITVENGDGLYLTNGFAVTHNSAHHPRQELVEAALSQTTNCRISLSSVRGMNNLFAQKRWSGKIPVFLFSWRSDPRKDDAWYQKQCNSLDPVVVAQEIDCDYSASVTGILIPGTWVRSAIDAHQKLGIAPAGKFGLSFDVADEGADKDAIGYFQGAEVLETREWSGKGGDIFESTQTVFNFCDANGLAEFRYDSDGLGAGVRGDARIINERRRANNARPIRAIGFRGSEAVHDPDGIVEGTIGLEGDKGRTNKDYYGNRKAQGWWALRKRFQKTHRWVVDGVACNPDDIISLASSNPSWEKLVGELSQITYRTNEAGKIIVDKRPDGQKSPNQADTLMIHYAPMEAPVIEVTQTMLQQIAAAGRRHRVG